MPSWLVNLLVSLAIKALEYFRDKNRLNLTHKDKIATIIPTSSMPDRNNPNMMHHYE